MDKLDPEQRSKIMSAIRSKNTKPEIFLRRALWAKGLRFRIHYCKMKIDIAFPGEKLAVFVDGCFWHGCPIHYHMPKSNQAYWKPKMEKNKQRDNLTNVKLQAQGWTVMRFWEHEIKSSSTVVEKIQKAIKAKSTER